MMYSLLRAAVAEITGIAPATDFAKPRSNPQPTQTQAGAVPLTPERVKEIVRGAGYDQCGIPDTERAAFINGLRHGEQAHGIKGGSMALSRDCRHGRQIGKCADCALDHMEMAADAEARRVDELTALHKQDTALIRQLLQALEGSIAVTMDKIDLRNAVIDAARAAQKERE